MSDEIEILYKKLFSQIDSQFLEEYVKASKISKEKKPEFESVWDQPIVFFSHWILLIGNVNDEQEAQIAGTLLRWKEFYQKFNANVICLQMTDQFFNSCAVKGNAKSFPTLLLCRDQKFNSFIRFDREFFLAMSINKNSFHQFLCQIHYHFLKSTSIKEIFKILQNDEFWRELQFSGAQIKQSIHFESSKYKHDVFLCHNTVNKQEVERLASKLKKRRVKVWFDKWDLMPGQNISNELEVIIYNVPSVIVVISDDGLGPWQKEEINACLRESKKRKIQLIPVILKGSTRSIESLEIPEFLKSFSVHDLRNGLGKKNIDKLIDAVFCDND